MLADPYTVGSGDSEFIAPELHQSQQWAEPQQTYVYSLGMTLYHALEYNLTEGEVGGLCVAEFSGG